MLDNALVSVLTFPKHRDVDVVGSVRLAVTLQCSAADKHECDVSIRQCVQQRFAPGVYVRVSHASMVAPACWSEISRCAGGPSGQRR